MNAYRYLRARVSGKTQESRERLPNFLILILSLGFLFSDTGACFAWGPTAHRLTNRWAIETLPPEVRGFFEANRQFLIDHANDPDAAMAKDAFERNRHYIYLDKYGIFPYLALPHSYATAVEQY